jgi:methyl-accepting chemotaxis protein
MNGSMDLVKSRDAIQNMKNTSQTLQNQVVDFRELSYQEFTQVTYATNTASQNAIEVGISIVIGNIVLLILISFNITHGICKSLMNVIYSLEDIVQGQGDLTKRITHTENQDEIGSLVRLFNQFIEKLQHTIKQVVSAIPPLVAIIDELSQLTRQSEENIKTQQTSTQLVSQAATEMVASVETVANNAGSAAQSAQQADTQAKHGLQVVQETTRYIQGLSNDMQQAEIGIKKLEQDSESVGMVLDVIKGIADQTNLLALNAAIEAARAGEQGRGFAVVADEVRNLATKTRESTEEIRKIVEELQNAARGAVNTMHESAQKVTVTQEKASNAGAALESITEMVSKIMELNVHIALATKEQTQTSHRIHHSTHEIGDIVNQSVGNVEKMSLSGEHLATLAKELQSISKQFIIE